MTSREPSEVDALADAYTLAAAELDPVFATEIGLLGYDGRMSEADPDFHDARDALVRDTLAKLETVTPRDAVDRVTNRKIARRMGPRRAGDPDSLVSDNRRIKATLPWQPRFADLDTIVGHALAWERRLGEIRGAA